MTDYTASIRDDELSADEQAYFKSKGTKEPPVVSNDAPEPAREAESAPQETNSEPETAQAAPEAGQEAENGADSGDRSVTGEKKVNFGALREERDRRKALEAKIEQMNQERMAQIQAERIKEAKVNQRLMQLMGGEEKQAAPETPGIPDPEQDFIEAQKWTMKKIQEREEREEREMQERQQSHQQRQHQEAVVNTYGRAVADAAKNDPVVGKAYEFLTAQHYRLLVADGMDPQQAQIQARRDEFEFAQGCIRDRVHPARRIMTHAQARGFNPAAVAAAAGAPSPARLDTIAEGQARNKTLAGAGSGGAPRGAIDMVRLAAMSDEDFAEFSAKAGAKGFKKAMGG